MPARAETPEFVGTACRLTSTTQARGLFALLGPGGCGPTTTLRVGPGRALSPLAGGVVASVTALVRFVREAAAGVLAN